MEINDKSLKYLNNEDIKIKFENNINNQIKKKENLLNKKSNYSKLTFLKFVFFFIIIIIFVLFKNLIINKQKYYKKINIVNQLYNALEINNPVLPITKKEYIVKNYYKTNYEQNNIRYNIQELYNNRTIFKINYSNFPYKNINFSLSYDQNANNIYSSTGMLNITKLDYYYYNDNIDTLNLNHIHLSMSFDKNYVLITSISIASILNTSSVDTYIHFHLILNNCLYDDIKLIISLKKIINKNVDLVFYNGKQAEYDFGNRNKKEHRGVGEYSRLLIPEIVNNTNKILILDSADIIAEKDLSEIFYFDLEDNYFAFSLDLNAGNLYPNDLFARNNYYFNGGVCLVNIRKFREDNLYLKSFLASLAYNYFPCPFQNILLIISNFKFKYLPLNFNSPQIFENDEQIKQKVTNTNTIIQWMNSQKNSPFRQTNKELLEAGLNPVITHLFLNKPFYGLANKKYTNIWLNYAKKIGVYQKIKEIYPIPFLKISKNKLLV